MADFEPARDEQGRFASSGGGGAAGPKEWAKKGAASGEGSRGGAGTVKDWASGAKPGEAHAKAAKEAKESSSRALHEEAMKQAQAPAAGGKGDLGGKREWVGRQTHPGKMEFEGQFAGKSRETIDDHFHEGKPTAARAEFHQKEIIEPAFAGKKTAAELGQAKPVAILTMGGPASGKGVVLGKLKEHGLDTNKFVHVDPDEVKGSLPEYKAQVPKDGGKTFVGAAAQVHEESSFVAKQIRDRAIEGGHNVVIDGTGGNADKFIQMIDHLKAKGYEVQVHHPDLGVDEGVKRALARAERSGRHVPEPFIRQTYEAIGKAQDKIKAAAGENYHRYDAGNGHRRVE
jgi:hypothetical protein